MHPPRRPSRTRAGSLRGANPNVDDQPHHKSPVDGWKGGWQPGVDPLRRDYASLADFADPDGNTWVIQEIGYAAGPGR